MTRPALASLLASMFIALPAHSAISVFNDLAPFQAATGATDATGPLPVKDVDPATLTVGSVTLFSNRWVITDMSASLPGNEVVISNGLGSVSGVANEGLDATFAGPVYAAGFDFYEPSVAFTADGLGCNTTCINSTFQVTLVGAGGAVGSFSYEPPNDVPTFVGVWSDTPFTKLEIRETVGSDDNEFYGRFYSGGQAMPAPEPQTYALVLAGLGLVGWATRRRA